jgi:hypothetical protein
MAGAKVPAPLDPMVNGDDWTNILARYNRTVKGSEGVSLTNWVAGNTDRPEIAAGSVVEIDGAPFEYATDETIVDEAGLTDGWCYIKHVVSGDAVTPTLTNTFGIWDTAKQGFYDGGDRYSLHVMYRSGAVIKIFTQKGFVSNNGILLQTPLTTDLNAQGHIEYTSSVYPGEKLKYKVLDITINNGNGSATVAHGISNAWTDQRILDVRTTHKYPEFLLRIYGGEYSQTSPEIHISRWYATDTELSIFRLGTADTLIFRSMITYV